MPDDRKKRGKADRDRVSTKEQYELKYEAKKTGASEAAVKRTTQEGRTDAKEYRGRAAQKEKIEDAETGRLPPCPPSPASKSMNNRNAGKFIMPGVGVTSSSDAGPRPHLIGGNGIAGFTP